MRSVCVFRREFACKRTFELIIVWIGMVFVWFLRCLSSAHPITNNSKQQTPSHRAYVLRVSRYMKKKRTNKKKKKYSDRYVDFMVSICWGHLLLLATWLLFIHTFFVVRLRLFILCKHTDFLYIQRKSFTLFVYSIAMWIWAVFTLDCDILYYLLHNTWVSRYVSIFFLLFI